MLEQALARARLLFAYSMFIKAPLDMVFRYTAAPEYWARDFDGEPLPNLSLIWEGRKYKPGSIMRLSPLRKDGTPTPVGSVSMELLHYEKNAELSFRFLTGTHLIYRFVYEQASNNRTEFTMNALIDAQSSPLNTLQQRLYAGRRRKDSIKNHMRVKGQLERRAQLQR